MVLAELGTGDVVGEMGVLASALRSATVTAATDVEALEVEAGPFLALLAGEPSASLALLRMMSQRLQQADELTDRLARVPGAG